MLPLVSAQRREQALRYKHTFGRFCCLKSWLMLEELSSVSLQHAEFLYNEHGKPYMANGPHFSISHCKAGIAVAIDDKPVGIDMEAIRHADDDLIQRVMCAREVQMISEAAMPDSMFTRLWTQKEAVVKYQGIGIESFEQLQTVLSEYRNTGTPEYRKLQTIETENYIYSIAYE